MNTFVYTPAARIPFLARKLAKTLHGKIIQQDKYPKSPWLLGGDTIVNYGGGTPPVWENFARNNPVSILNHWDAVKRSANKISALKALDDSGVHTLAWTTVKEEAAEFYDRTVVRALVASTCSKGISVVEGDDLPDAPLYTRYFKKKFEFRVHVFDGKVIDYTQKKMLSEESRKAKGIEPVPYIRSYGNGWIFSRHNIAYFREVDELAIAAAAAIGLDFAGVDILCNTNKDGTFKNAVVCETNAAPGMQKSTFVAYKKAFQKRIGAY